MQVFHAYICVQLCLPLILSGWGFRDLFAPCHAARCSTDNKRSLLGFSVSFGFPHSPGGFSPQTCFCKQQLQRREGQPAVPEWSLKFPLWFIVNCSTLRLSQPSLVWSSFSFHISSPFIIWRQSRLEKGFFTHKSGNKKKKKVLKWHIISYYLCTFIWKLQI